MKKWRWWLSGLSCLGLAVLLPVESRATTFTVNTTVDGTDVNPGDGKCETRPGNGVCTLRAAVEEAIASAGSNTVLLPAGAYVLTLLAPCIFFGENSTSLCIARSVAIEGADASTTFIDGNQHNQALVVTGAGTAVTVSGVTIRNAHSSSFFNFGGGIYIRLGSVSLVNCVVTGNIAFASGGGVYNDQGTLALTGVPLNANTSGSGGGGGIFNIAGTVTISNSALDGNTSAANGGAIFNFGGTVTITGSSLTNNHAQGSGGAVSNTGTSGPGVINNAVVNLVDSTLSGNSSGGSGGAIDNGFNSNFITQVNLSNVTLTNNISSTMGSGSGGGIFNNGGSVNAKNTILAGNKDVIQGYDDCATSPPQLPLNSQGYNIVGNTSGCNISGDLTGNLTGVDPKLDVLTNNGGPTQTIALLPGSPAIDAGNPAIPGSGGNACAGLDQRGFLRPFGKACDIGAFESVGTFSVTGVVPNTGGNGGSVVALVSGNAFLNGATVKLARNGQPDIAGTPVAVDPGGSVIATAFDLTDKATGTWNVVVTNVNAAQATLPGAFVIQSAQAPQLWVDLVGPPVVRPGVPTGFNILYGNRGNVDAIGATLGITVTQGFGFTPVFPIAPPPTQTRQVTADWTQVPVTALPDKQGLVSYPLLLPVVPAGFTGSLPFSLLLPRNEPEGTKFVTTVGINPTTYFDPGLDAQVINTILAGAKTYAQQNLGVTLSAGLDPSLQQYLSNQLESVVRSGRNTLVNSLGVQSIPYSTGQLLIDLAQFGAAQAKASANTSPASTVEACDVRGRIGAACRVPSERDNLTLLHLDADCPVVCCDGRTLKGGCSCTQESPPCPPPGEPPPPGPITPADCQDMAGWHVVRDQVTGQLACVPNSCLCSNSVTPSLCGSSLCQPGSGGAGNSVDPNDKVGARGVGSARYLTGTAPFRYSISFSNEPTATLPAQVVVITDQLDTANVDLKTFSFGPITFGTTTMFPPPGSAQFNGAVDLKPTGKNLIVRVDAKLNAATGLVSWRFTSLDPATLQQTQNPAAGFLPPDTNPPRGEGRVLFTIKPRQTVSTGTSIRNMAQVIFDLNPPIDTPVWSNTIDNSKPSSHVVQLPASESTSTFPLHWTGTDQGSGISDFSIFVSQNSGPFTPFLSHTTQTSANFAGVPGSAYAFYSIAEDLAGNIEDPHAVPDATTSIAQGTPHISGSIAAKGRDVSGALFVDLQLANTGTGDARGVTISQVLTRTLSGTGSVTYDAAKSPPVPTTAGDINAGASVTIRLFFNVPATVTKFSITENGSLEDVKSVIYNFSAGEAVIP